MRQEREEFRKSIVKLIIRKEENLSGDIFPNSNERQLLRYYQYIAHGIDACHVAPISKRILKRLIKKHIISSQMIIIVNCRIIIIDDYRIVSFVSKKSPKWSEIVQSNLNQIKSEYIFTSKKAVVDFALGNSLDRITNEEKNLKNVRHKIGSIPYEHEYNLQNI